MRSNTFRWTEHRARSRILPALFLLFVLIVPAAQAATTLYLRDTIAIEPMPNVKQSSDTITHDYASTIATYANPAALTFTARFDKFRKFCYQR